MTIRVDVVRVFTDENGDFGNELGILESSGTTHGREQQIAAELGFSETVFIDDVVAARATIQIFTPAGELSFAGHPSVGTAWWFAHTQRSISALAEKAGDVVVRYDKETVWIAGRSEWAPDFSFKLLDTPDEVDALDPDSYNSGMNYAYSWIDESAGIIRSRMFGPEHHIREDEATGAAAIRVSTLVGRNLTIHQGRGSRIQTRVGVDGLVEVGGRTVWDRQLELD